MLCTFGKSQMRVVRWRGAAEGEESVLAFQVCDHRLILSSFLGANGLCPLRNRL